MEQLNPVGPSSDSCFFRRHDECVLHATGALEQTDSTRQSASAPGMNNSLQNKIKMKLPFLVN